MKAKTGHIKFCETQSSAKGNIYSTKYKHQKREKASINKQLPTLEPKRRAK